MLKTIIALLTFVAAFTTATAQETEGHVVYTVEFSSKQPEMQMQLAMLQGSKLDMYFTEGKTRTEFKVGTMMQTTTIVHNKTREMVILLSGIMGNKAISDKLEESQPEAVKRKVELVNETKEIAGFTCKKAVVTDEAGKTYDFWYTEKIKAVSEGQKYFAGNGIPGFPMQMQISQNGMDIKMTASSFEKLPKKHKYFDLSIPEGYQTMTEEELNMMMRGGM